MNMLHYAVAIGKSATGFQFIRLFDIEKINQSINLFGDREQPEII